MPVESESDRLACSKRWQSKVNVKGYLATKDASGSEILTCSNKWQ